MGISGGAGTVVRQLEQPASGGSRQGRSELAAPRLAVVDFRGRHSEVDVGARLTIEKMML